MTGHTPADLPAPDAFDHPADLLERDDVDVEDVPGVTVHQHHFELYDPIEAVAVVGVTDDRGRLLLEVHDEEPVAMLPHARLDAGDDRASVAAAAVAERTGVAVEVDGVVGVRRERYTPDDPTDDREATAYHLFLSATPAGQAAVPADAGPEAVTVGWHDELPVDPEAADDRLTADIWLFLDRPRR